MNSSFEKIRNIQNNNNNNNDKSRVMKSLKIIQYSRIIPKIYRQKTKYQTLTLNTSTNRRFERRITCIQVSSQSCPKRMITRRSSSARIA